MNKYLYLFIAIVITACNSNSSKPDDKQLNILVNRSCRAVSIRQLRFELANKIRYAQDTAFKSSNRQEANKAVKNLDSYMKQKDSLLKLSLQLADTIHKQLDSLLPADKDERFKVSQRFNALLAKRGCIVNTQAN